MNLIEKLENRLFWLRNKRRFEECLALEYKDNADGFKWALDIVKQHSDWVSVDDELLPDEVECVFETNDGWRFVGDFREKRGIVNHRYGYEMIEDIKRWQPIQPPSEVQDAI